jgi:hypothetical protein
MIINFNGHYLAFIDSKLNSSISFFVGNIWHPDFKIILFPEI